MMRVIMIASMIFAVLAVSGCKKGSDEPTLPLLHVKGEFDIVEFPDLESKHYVVKSNQNWIITGGEKGWLEFDKKNGNKGETTFSVKIKENESAGSEPRQDAFTISTEDGKASQQIKVTQYPQDIEDIFAPEFAKIVKTELGIKDRRIRYDDVKDVKSLHVKDQNLPSIKGIEAFKNLEGLGCNNCQLEAVDLTKNVAIEQLSLWGNKLNEIDLSKNVNLKVVGVFANQLSKLDVSNNHKIQILLCHNNQLTELNITNNPALEYLMCVSNKIKKLDLSKNPLLYRLEASFNDLTELNVSKNPLLVHLDCRSCYIKSLDLTKNAELGFLACQNNLLSGTIDLTKNTKLTKTRYADTYEKMVLLDKNPDLKTVKVGSWYDNLASEDKAKFSLGTATLSVVR